MKKTLFTLRVDNYAPDICDITYPFLKRYAKKIGADFVVIEKRKYPDMPVTYEKLQIRELSKGNDWNIYIDSDTLIHPDSIDFTEFIEKDTVAHNKNDFANIRWRYDKYFRRDGRNIGSGNWLGISSDWTVEDFYAPLDIPLEEALENITPTAEEQRCGITKCHLIDDYTLSRNIARYGLKFKWVDTIIEENVPGANVFWHTYLENQEEKVKQLKEVAGKMR